MILQTVNLSHIYGSGTPFAREALHAVNFSLEEGLFTGLIGHTGSGKSTLIQHLNGLLKPASGEVLFAGRSIWEDPKAVRRIRFQVGLVFQYPEHQLFEETVERDIAFGPRNMGLTEVEIALRVREAMEFVGLSPSLKGASPFDLSGGQRRRAAIAGVIAMRPQVLILDEPTAGLDPQGREEILRHLRDYHRSRGATVLLVTHSMEDIARVCDRITVLSDARVRMSGTPGEVFSQPERLREIGLEAPAITRVMQRLRAMGVDINDRVYTLGAARDELLRARRRLLSARRESGEKGPGGTAEC